MNRELPSTIGKFGSQFGLPESHQSRQYGKKCILILLDRRSVQFDLSVILLENWAHS
jgi:hypothetical protein